MTTALTVAIISAAVSLASVASSLPSGQRAEPRDCRRTDSAPRARDPRTAPEQLVKHYRYPSLLAAFDLQSRLFNIVPNDFFAYLRGGDTGEREYARTNTLKIICLYM